MSGIDTLSRPSKVIATVSELREQGREEYRFFGAHVSNPYARSDDTCAFENWLEGFLQAQYAAEWARRHRS